MAKILVIMEAPAKAKKVQSFLGKDYIVWATGGHLRELKTDGDYYLGIDLETMKPRYQPIPDRVEIINKLKEFANNAEQVYLATDPDREGEAIAYSLQELLRCKSKSYRLIFNEITKPAVMNAIANKTKVDMNLVKAQETRRILDRLLGFRLSNLLKVKIDSKSAGRVQSVALKLIVKRYFEHQNFKPVEYWNLFGLHRQDQFELTKINNNKVEKTISSQQMVNDIIADLTPTSKITNIVQKPSKSKGISPLITSTVLQKANSKYDYPTETATKILQTLYEQGIISYPRTDSTRLNDDFIRTAQDYLTNKFGPEYLLTTTKKQKSKLNVQDAHEAIRPTNLNHDLIWAKEHLPKEQYNIYKLIWEYTLGSLMAPAQIDRTIVTILNKDKYEFTLATGIISFMGVKKLLDDKEEDEEDLLTSKNTYQLGSEIKFDEILPKQSFTKPEPLFTEASLIKVLEELGVGRPATYATIFKILRTREYVTLNKKAYEPTTQGIKTIDYLEKAYQSIIDEYYTANMEKVLDQIAEGKLDSKDYLIDFWLEFNKKIKQLFRDRF
ncbi:type I DNA topoisomerase [Spiroplasma sp. DGKH1]|uniref:type I DNA topoisomerase n=1 Tax=Spiroplasma sp. DGKH1 TaxID=3050074 RepID=UPI0034C5E6AC